MVIKVTSKHQITIPKDIADAFNLKNRGLSKPPRRCVNSYEFFVGSFLTQPRIVTENETYLL
jgi:hypothetical protein